MRHLLRQSAVLSSGAIAALRRNTIIDKIIMVITTAFVSMPSFIMGSLLLLIFAVTFHILPANGNASGGLILPVITLALYPMAYITRLTRSSMLDVLGQDYIRTAKAKGVSGMRIIFGHIIEKCIDSCFDLFWSYAGFLLPVLWLLRKFSQCLVSVEHLLIVLPAVTIL